MICKLCASSEQLPSIGTVASPFVDADYSLYKCDACGSMFFDADEHPLDLDDVYSRDTQRTRLAERSQFSPCKYWSGEVRAIRSVACRPIRSVVDLGCRTGDFLMHWDASVRRVGVEIAADYAEVGRERGLEIAHGRLEDAEFDEPFDAVTCYAVLEHLVDPVAFLRALPAIVRDRGVLAVLVPTHESLLCRYHAARGSRWHQFAPPQHLNFFGRRRFDEVLADLGFRLVRRRFTSGGVFNPFGKGSRSGRLFGRAMWVVDHCSGISRLPVFDHMYSYYIKAGRTR